MAVPGFISDEEMVALESGSAPSSGVSIPGFISDEQMDAMSGQKPASFRDVVNQESGLGTNMASGFLSGVAGLGDLADLAVKYNPFNPTPIQLRPQTPSVGQGLRSIFDSITGVENSTQINPDSYAHSIAEALPSTFSLNPLAIASSVGAGAGSQVAKDVGLPEWAGALALGVAPAAVAGTVKAAVKPFTAGGQQALAAEELLFNAGKEGRLNLQQALESGATSSPLGGKLTYAEMANTPSAAAFQTAMRKIPGEGTNALERALVGSIDDPGRAIQATNALEELAPSAMKGITPDVRGATIRGMGKESVLESDRMVREAWDSIGKTGQRIGIGQTATDLRGVREQLDTPLGYSKDAEKVFDSLFTLDGAPKSSLTITEYQKIRSAAGEVMVDASARGRNREAALMAELRNKLDDSATRIAKTQTMQGKKVSALQEAIDVTRREKELFETGSVKEIFRKGEGGYALRDSAVPGKVINTPEGAKQFMKAFGDDAELVSQARGALIDDLTRTKEPGTWLKNFEGKKAQFKALFGEDVRKVQDVLADIESLKRVGELATRASKGQSVTSQALTVSQKLLTDGPRALTKILASKGGQRVAPLVGFSGGIPGALVGVGAAKIAKWSEDAIQRYVIESLANPEKIAELMKKSTSGNFTKAISQIAPTVLARAGSGLTSSQPRRAETTETTQGEAAPQKVARSSSQAASQTSLKSSTDPIEKALNRAESRIMEKNQRVSSLSDADKTYLEMTDPAKPTDSFLSKKEGGQRLDAYPPPAKGSGVTVATGVDLGQWSKSDLEKAGVPAPVIRKVSKYLGVKDASARALLKEKPLNLTKSEADSLDKAIADDIFGTVETKLKREGVTLEKLPPEAQTVVKSIAYNFGKNFDEKLPSFWKAITRRDWAKLQDLLMTTKWKQKSLKARRLEEAALLDKLIQV